MSLSDKMLMQTLLVIVHISATWWQLAGLMALAPKRACRDAKVTPKMNLGSVVFIRIDVITSLPGALVLLLRCIRNGCLLRQWQGN